MTRSSLQDQVWLAAALIHHTSAHAHLTNVSRGTPLLADVQNAKAPLVGRRSVERLLLWLSRAKRESANLLVYVVYVFPSAGS